MPQIIYHISLFIYLLTLSSQTTSAQQSKGTNACIKDYNVHTLNIYARNDINAFPIIELNSKQTILVNFDYFEENNQNITYQIIHCDADWIKSSISEYSYFEGFPLNHINKYEFSFNTNINYTNYTLEIPNEDIKLTKSGNYKLITFKTESKRDTLFIAKFSILESLVKINGRVRPCTNPREIEKSQEVDFSIENDKIQIHNPIKDIRTFIWQNGNQHNRKELKPIFIRDNSYSFDYNEENVFLAGNEYRQFNTNNKKLIGRFIESIIEDTNDTYFTLTPAYNRQFKSYVYEKDINGKYIINADNKNNSNTESDYIYVNFTLAMDCPLDKDIYVYGKLSNWGIEDKFKMKYDIIIKAYRLSLLLKQGYYNYEYIVHDSGTLDRNFIEGSHYQTENDYTISVYFKDYSESYYRLIGYKELNSNTLK